MTILLNVSDIIIEAPRRPVVQAKAEELAKSIEAVGLINPITVNDKKGLIAGRHRMEAFRLLGRPQIPVSIVSSDPTDNELIEIDENLIRSDLTVLEQSSLMARRVQIMNLKGLRAGVGRPAKESEANTTQSLADELGVSKRTLQKRLQIANNLAPEVKDKLANTPVANQSEKLLELSRFPEEDQLQIANQLLEQSIQQELAQDSVQIEDENGKTTYVPKGSEDTLSDRWKPVKLNFESEAEVVAYANQLKKNKRLKTLLSSESVEWETPQDFFDVLHAEFNFALDVCATSENAKCGNYFNQGVDGLAQAWEVPEDRAVWCNPPYGKGLYNWIQKGFSAALSKQATVVMLINAKTDTQYWHDFCRFGEIRFVKGRLSFGDADANTYPSAVVIFHRDQRTPQTFYWDWKKSQSLDLLNRELPYTTLLTDDLSIYPNKSNAYFQQVDGLWYPRDCQ